MNGRKRAEVRRMPSRDVTEFRPVNPDEAVLNLLRRGSVDMNEKRPVCFYLYFPTRKAAETAGDQLKELGYSIDSIERSSNSAWLCLVENYVVPAIGELNSIRRLMERIVCKLGGEYDGWETKLDIDESKGMPGCE